MSRIAILGAGAFGTALALVLARAGREVVLWGRDPGRAAVHLPGVTLPPGLEPTADLSRTDAAGTVLLAVPTQALAGFLAPRPGALPAARWWPAARASTWVRDWARRG